MTEPRLAPITGYEGRYMIADHGHVWRCPRVIHRVHTGPYTQPGAWMADWEGTKFGHRCITLYDDLGVRTKHWIHRLVAEHFIPNPDNLPWVLHGVRGPADNHYTNLRWGNQSENEKDKLRHKVARQEQRHG